VASIPKNAPAIRQIDIRSLDYALSGPEPPYPVYQFSGYRVKWEYPGHNPFGPTPLGVQNNIGPNANS